MSFITNLVCWVVLLKALDYFHIYLSCVQVDKNSHLGLEIIRRLANDFPRLTFKNFSLRKKILRKLFLMQTNAISKCNFINSTIKLRVHVLNPMGLYFANVISYQPSGSIMEISDWSTFLFREWIFHSKDCNFDNIFVPFFKGVQATMQRIVTTIFSQRSIW